MLGALFGLAIAIFLIVRKIPPAYSMMIGALLGGLLGGNSLTATVGMMIGGAGSVMPAIVRILAAGVLSGVLVTTGAAQSISNAVIKRLGGRFALAAIAVTTMVLCAVGVFIDVAVITMAPVALSTAKRLNISTPVVLLTMIGGGKCGNVMSANPNTISAAENFSADLLQVMAAGVIPALIGLAVTVIIVTLIAPKSRLLNNTGSGPNLAEISKQETDDVKQDDGNPQDSLPALWASLAAPLVAIVLLALRPIAGITIDPLVALPVGGLVGLLAMRKWKMLFTSLGTGLKQMSPVAVLLIGTGTIAGIISNSGINEWLLSSIEQLKLSPVLIAPLAGALMSAATASTTAGATVASASFSGAVLAAGISPVWGAAMVNAGATVLDHLPHGSFFHATGGAAQIDFNRRLRLIPYECLIGFVLALTSTLITWVAW